MSKKLSPDALVCKLLRLGQKRIKRHWTKHTYHARGAYCLLGSIGHANAGTLMSNLNVDTLTEFYRLRDKAAAYLQRALPTQELNVVVFNDMPTTNKKDVLKVMDKAIEYCEKGK